MISVSKLEESFLEFSHQLGKYVPDGVIVVDLQMLHTMGLLRIEEFDTIKRCKESSLLFHLIETEEKITLFNEQFAVWILPKIEDNRGITLTFIALLQEGTPHLELVFETSGVYNSPSFILKILKHFLKEVCDNEALISAMDRIKH